MKADLLKDGEKSGAVEYQILPGKKVSTLIVLPGEDGGGSNVLPGKVEPDEVAFALPTGIAELDAAHTWQLRDHETGKVRTIVAGGVSNGLVWAAIQP